MARVRIALPKQLLHDLTLSVRIADLNYGAHLSNVAILGYAHEARVDWLSKMGYSEMDVAGMGLIQADAEIAYRNQAFLGDSLVVSLFFGAWTSRGFELIYKIERPKDKSEIARLKTGMVFFDYQQQALGKIPETFKQEISNLHLHEY